MRFLEKGHAICYPSGCIVTSFRFSPRPNRAHEISWQEWGVEAFDEARASDKPVLLSISAVWCHWCHVMDETSFSDTEVISLINQHYIPIRVDNDQRPDINARYNRGGWPSIAFLTPCGDVITGATYMPPQQLRTALAQVSACYKTQKSALSDRAAALRDRRQGKVALASAGAHVDASIVDNVLKAVVDAYDPRYGGFGSAPKFPMVSAVELLLHAYQSTGEARYLKMVQNTLDHMMGSGLYDHEEGGFFRYSTTRDWSVPHFEKMLEDNVGLLRLYLRSYLVTGHEEYAGVASRITDYLNGHLYDDASGAFYGSQDADEEYYRLPVAQRLKQAPPGVDQVFYTGLNAAVASTYMEAAWLLDRPELKVVAIGTLDLLLGRCQGKPLSHGYFAEGGEGVHALVADYGCLVMALMDGYRETGRQRYLDEAQRMGREMTDTFWDAQSGGFFDIPEDPHAIGAMKVRDKPMVSNVPAIEAITGLLRSTLKEEYRQVAETALSAFVPVHEEHGEAASAYALAVDRFLYEPVEVSVVGVRGSAETNALLTAAATIPYPHTAVRYIDSGDEDRLSAEGYWPSNEPQAYVCLDTVCLPPIGNPQVLQETVIEFLSSRTEGQGSILQAIGDLEQTAEAGITICTPLIGSET